MHDEDSRRVKSFPSTDAPDATVSEIATQEPPPSVEAIQSEEFPPPDEPLHSEGALPPDEPLQSKEAPPPDEPLQSEEGLPPDEPLQSEKPPPPDEPLQPEEPPPSDEPTLQPQKLTQEPPSASEEPSPAPRKPPSTTLEETDPTSSVQYHAAESPVQAADESTNAPSSHTTEVATLSDNESTGTPDDEMTVTPSPHTEEPAPATQVSLPLDEDGTTIETRYSSNNVEKSPKPREVTEYRQNHDTPEQSPVPVPIHFGNERARDNVILKLSKVKSIFEQLNDNEQLDGNDTHSSIQSSMGLFVQSIIDQVRAI